MTEEDFLLFWNDDLSLLSFSAEHYKHCIILHQVQTDYSLAILDFV